MKSQVLKAIERFSLLDNRNITVALSGGADSMALLSVLLEIKGKFSLNITAAHFNHRIRGAEADRDEAFVKEYCEKKGVELFLGSGDVPSYAKEQGLSLELAARELRYEFLKSVSKGNVATAHTASDNAETVIFNLTRGSGAEGLCGIPPKRDIFIRPLILATREQIEEYCKENDIPFVNDSTNFCDDYTRNKIRHNVIPVLKQINPSFEGAVLKTSSILKEDSSYLNSLADEFLEQNLKEDKLRLEDFKELSVSVAKRVIRKFIEKEDISPENIHIEEAYNIALFGGKTNLPKDYHLISKKGYLFFEKEAFMKRKSVKITESENTFFENCQKVNNLFLNNAVDCDKIIGNWEIRTRLSGDSIRLKGRGCTKPLNKLFSELGIPANLRDEIPVIADEKGIVWVMGVGVAERCAVTKNSKRVYIIEV